MFFNLDGTQLDVPSLFADYFFHRETVAWVGAGLSRSLGMPDWGGLIGHLVSLGSRLSASRASTAHQLLQDGRLSDAASVLKASLSAKDFQLAINHLFGDEAKQRAEKTAQQQTDERIRALVEANWAGIVTTNYDSLIEQHLASLKDDAWVANVQNHGSPNPLGHILSMANEHRMFFIKLHGTTSSDGLILTTQDYDDAYVRTPQIGAFLTAVFLRYHVIFLGCSMDDEVVRIRRRLFAEFNRHLPKSFVLFADEPGNKARGQLLTENSGILPVFYNNDAKTFQGVNDFLIHIKDLPRMPRAARDRLRHSAEGDRAMRLSAGHRRLMALFVEQKQVGQERTFSANEPKEKSCEEICALMDDEARATICGNETEDYIEHIVRSRLENLTAQRLLVETCIGTERTYQISPRLTSKDFAQFLA